MNCGLFDESENDLFRKSIIFYYFVDLEMMRSKAKEYIAGLMRVTDREMQIGRTFYGETYSDR